MQLVFRRYSEDIRKDCSRLAYLHDFARTARKLLTHGLRVPSADGPSAIDFSLPVKLVIGPVRENEK